MTNPLLALVLCCLCSACFSAQEISDAQCPEEGTTLSYQNFAADFIDRYCQSCHASSASNRAGAPASVHFDNLDEVRSFADRIYGRSAMDNTSMPPGPNDPPVQERQALGEWLACGAP